MATQPSTWEDIKQLADQVELRIHLGSMEAHDRWLALRPRIDRLERTISRVGRDAAESIKRELEDVRVALRALRDETMH